MIDFRNYAHEKKKELLKGCNAILRKLNIKEKELANIDIYDERFSIHDDRHLDFEHSYSLIFNDILNWLREEWLWLPLKWEKVQLRKKNLSIPFTITGKNCDFHNLSDFFTELAEIDFESDKMDLYHNLIFPKKEFIMLNNWIKENRNKRQKEIENKIYAEKSQPCEELKQKAKDFINLVSKNFGIEHNLIQKELEFVFGNCFLIHQLLEHLLRESIKKIYLVKYRRMSYNPQDSNYYLKYLEDIDPYGESRFEEIFKFNLITEVFKLDIDSSRFISIYFDFDKIILINDFFDKNVLVKISDLVIKYFEPFWLSREKYIKKHGLSKRNVQKLIETNKTKDILQAISNQLTIKDAIDTLSKIEDEYKKNDLILGLNNEIDCIVLTSALSLLDVEDHTIIEPICNTIPINESLANLALVTILNKFKDNLDKTALLPLLSTYFNYSNGFYLNCYHYDCTDLFQMMDRFGSKDYSISFDIFRKIPLVTIRKIFSESLYRKYFFLSSKEDIQQKAQEKFHIINTFSSINVLIKDTISSIILNHNAKTLNPLLNYLKKEQFQFLRDELLLYLYNLIEKSPEVKFPETIIDELYEILDKNGPLFKRGNYYLEKGNKFKAEYFFRKSIETGVDKEDYLNSIEYLYEAWDFNRLTPEEELSYFLDFLENTINDLSVSNKRWAQETINEIRFILEYYENQRFLEEQGY